MRQHRPRVIVYDIALPYDANWRLFQNLRTSPAAEGVRFVVTTTNERRLAELAKLDGESVLEIVGKPYEADLLSARVRAAFDDVAAAE